MPVNNAFLHQAPSLASVARDVFTVVPSNSEPFETVPFGLVVGTGGTLRVTTVLGVLRDLVVSDGESLPVVILQVYATGTTATNIKAYVQ